MKKAIVVTIFKVPNYGSVLQALATRLTLENLGLRVCFLDYRPEYKKEKRTIKHSIKDIAGIILGMLKLNKRYTFLRRLNQFTNKELDTTKTYNSLEEITNDGWSSYDIAIAGSDQIWNPRFNFGDSVFMLSFIPPSVLKTSFASSFGCDSIPECFIDIYKKNLSTFNSITVRESNGLGILREQLQIDLNITHILDPTLLLDSQQWLSRLNIKTTQPKKKYLLLYKLSYAFNSVPFIYRLTQHLSENYDLEVIMICDRPTEYKKHGLKCAKNMSGTTVKNFVKFFAEAEMIVTTSFHGTAFAINFGKPFIAFTPSDKDDRQTSLLNQLGIGHCAIRINANPAYINPFYNFDDVRSKLSDLRQQSFLALRTNCMSNL